MPETRRWRYVTIAFAITVVVEAVFSFGLVLALDKEEQVQQEIYARLNRCVRLKVEDTVAVTAAMSEPCSCRTCDTPMPCPACDPPTQCAEGQRELPNAICTTSHIEDWSGEWSFRSTTAFHFRDGWYPMGPISNRGYCGGPEMGLLLQEADYRFILNGGGNSILELRRTQGRYGVTAQRWLTEPGKTSFNSYMACTLLDWEKLKEPWWQYSREGENRDAD